MNNQLQKAIKLAKKTGDRLIVFESLSSDDPFVLMSLEAYENIAIGRSEVRGLTEEELLDKINRDIAIWKSEQDFGVQNQSFFSDNQPYSTDQENRENRTMDNDNEEGREMSRNTGRKNPWAIPSDRKLGAEEIVDIDEDRQYLEEI